jgi:hypothetical protein
MDFLAMKQAMINALQQQVVTLENNIKYLSDLNDDTVLVGNCLVESLKIIMSGKHTSDDLEYAQEVLQIWNDHYAGNCEDCK